MEHTITELDALRFLEHVKTISGNKHIYVLKHVMNIRFIGHTTTADILIAATSQLILDIERETHSGISLEITPDKFCWLWRSLPFDFVAAMRDYNDQPARFANECYMI
jgi:hypothetical protein